MFGTTDAYINNQGKSLARLFLWRARPSYPVTGKTEPQVFHNDLHAQSLQGMSRHFIKLENSVSAWKKVRVYNKGGHESQARVWRLSKSIESSSHSGSGLQSTTSAGNEIPLPWLSRNALGIEGMVRGWNIIMTASKHLQHSIN